MKSLLEQFDIDQYSVQRMMNDAVGSGDDGELFMEYHQNENLTFDNGKLKFGGFSTAQGFGLRAISGEASAFAHSGEMSKAALGRACDAVVAVHGGKSGQYAAAPARTNRKLYGEENPLGDPSFEEKVKILEEIDAYARAKDERVRQVSASIGGSWQVVEILRADGHLVRDVRPLVRLNVSIVAGIGERQENGSYGMGGRRGFAEFLTSESWKSAVDAALKQAFGQSGSHTGAGWNF